MNYKMMLNIMLIVILISGCSGSLEVSQERSKLAKKNGEIVIGVAWPFASKGDLFEEGIDLAAEEINAKGGILGSPLRLVKEDDKSSITHGLSVAQSFANNLDMVAVIGHRDSAITIPAAAIYENAGLLMMTPASTSPKLTNLGYKYVFRSIPNDEQIGQQMSQYAVSRRYRNIAIFYKDDAYGKGLANAFEHDATESGINIIDRISSYSDLNDLQRIADMWTILGVEAVFLADVMPEGAEFITKLRQVGVDVPIIGGDGLDSENLDEIGGNAVEGTVVASVFNPNDKSEQTAEFVKVFTDKYKVSPNTWAAQGYDAVHLLADAIKAAGSRIPADTAIALKEMKAWAGVTGNHSFDSNGDVKNKPIVKKIFRNGQFEYLDEGGR
jgi:branched-chain amino acid transport system substrate-binding protein